MFVIDRIVLGFETLARTEAVVPGKFVGGTSTGFPISLGSIIMPLAIKGIGQSRVFVATARPTFFKQTNRCAPILAANT